MLMQINIFSRFWLFDPLAMAVRLYICTPVCLYACTRLRLYPFTPVCPYACTAVRLYGCTPIRLYCSTILLLFCYCIFRLCLECFRYHLLYSCTPYTFKHLTLRYFAVNYIVFYCFILFLLYASSPTRIYTSFNFDMLSLTYLALRWTDSLTKC